MPPLILFPAHMLHDGQVDAAFADEARLAEEAGFQIGHVGLESYFGDEVTLRRVPRGVGEVLYRGWILKEDDYRRLEEVIASRGGSLVTPAEAYLHCYHFPRWYQAIREHTPRSIWIPPTTPLEAIAQAVHEQFGAGGAILKDHVKSRKHEWWDACYIPRADDEENVRRVTKNFLDRQEEFLVGNLVYREYVKLRQIGIHPKSRLPLVNEHRLFVHRDQVLFQAPYWADGDYSGSRPAAEEVEPILGKVQSPFYAVDVAEREEGGWIVVEINDGSTAGIPEGGDARRFYEALRAAAW